MTLLCAVPTCAVQGRHGTDCPGDTCRGCQPALAADTLYLCGRHVQWIGTDAVEAARLHGELALVLAGTGGGAGQHVSGGGTPTGLALNELAAEWRATIRHRLVNWVLLCHDQTGWHLPADRVTDIAAWIDRHRQWFAGRDLGAVIAEEMAELVQVARPLAYPTGTRRFAVAGCPRCGGDLMATLRTAASLLPHELVCAEDISHTWTRAQWLDLADQVQPRRDEPVKVPVRSATVGHGGWAGRRTA